MESRVNVIEPYKHLESPKNLTLTGLKLNPHSDLLLQSSSKNSTPTPYWLQSIFPSLTKTPHWFQSWNIKKNSKILSRKQTNIKLHIYSTFLSFTTTPLRLPGHPRIWLRLQFFTLESFWKSPLQLQLNFEAMRFGVKSQISLVTLKSK